MNKIIGIIAFLLVGTANANLIELSWTTTASFLTSGIPGVDGEEITTILTVDNGGTSTISQSWTADDFVSYRMEGFSGWWIESDFISSGSGSFSTDDQGNVITAGSWISGTSTATITTSWSGVVNGRWWNNGFNPVVCSTTDCVNATNVEENIIGSSWTASEVSAVPVPAAVWLFGSGLIGLIGVARRKNA